MKISAFVISILLFFNLSAQQKYCISLCNIKDPQKTNVFYEGDKVIVYFNDTNEVCGQLKSISPSQLVVDSITIPTSSIQIIIDRKPKSGMFKLAGAGMVLGGAALVAGGFYLLVPGILSPSVESLYLIPGGLLLDYFGVSFIIRGIGKIGGKGKQYDIGYRWNLQIIAI